MNYIQQLAIYIQQISIIDFCGLQELKTLNLNLFHHLQNLNHFSGVFNQNDLIHNKLRILFMNKEKDRTMYHWHHPRNPSIVSLWLTTSSLNPFIHIINFPFVETTGTPYSPTISGNSFCPTSTNSPSLASLDTKVYSCGLHP